MEMTTRKNRQPAPATNERDVAPIVPPVDIVENDEGITLKADLPGVWKESLAIGVDGDTLSIEGAVSLGEPARLEDVHAEIQVAKYKRSFVLSRDLDSAKIDAALKNGVLTLTIPKLEQAKPRRIAVKAA